MVTVEDIKKCTNIHNIPKSVHCNKNIILDFRLCQALGDPDYENNRDIRYDFDVYLPKYGMNLQRPYVWEDFQKREYIMSILQDDNDFQKRSDRTNHVIDGKQRLMTIQKFLHNEFPIIVEGKEAFWSDFDDDLKFFFMSRVNNLTAYVYYSYENHPITDDMKIVLFNYYNFAGTPQTEEHKNRLQALLNNNE